MDPGIEGAIAFLYENGEVAVFRTPKTVEVYKYPRAKTKSGRPKVKRTRHYCMYEMSRLVADHVKRVKSPKHVIAGIEKQQQRQTDSKRVVFEVGRNQGVWEMAIAALRIPYVLIRPTEWKPQYVAKGADKSASRFAAKQRYPQLDFPLKKDADLAEALLIADYTRRKYPLSTDGK